jgi:hypothetical protein
MLTGPDGADHIQAPDTLDCVRRHVEIRKRDELVTCKLRREIRVSEKLSRIMNSGP